MRIFGTKKHFSRAVESRLDLPKSSLSMVKIFIFRYVILFNHVQTSTLLINFGGKVYFSELLQLFATLFCKKMGHSLGLLQPYFPLCRLQLS